MKHLSPAEIETIRVPEPKHDPFTLESLVAWLERQPADGEYRFMDLENCLMSQYFRAQGYRVYLCGGTSFHYWKPRLFWFPRLVRQYFPSSFSMIAVDSPRTFGAALTRARAALASQKGNANG